MTTTTRTLADKIRAQAEGSYPTEAAALLITTACRGRLLDQLPLLFVDDTRAAIDWETGRQTLGYLSSGEQRMFDLADSLFTGQPINLSDALSGLDDHNARTALRAISYTLRVRIHSGGLR